MNAVCLSFCLMLRMIRRDMMLAAALLGPVLAGVAMRGGVPFLESLLATWTGEAAALTPYYGLADVFLSSLAPVLYGFAAAMVILEEHDDRVDRYLFVTGLGKTGYLVSRAVLPSVFAFAATAALLPVFGLSGMSAAWNVLLALAGAMQGIVVALMIVAFASNKLEGMAAAKLSSLLMLGAAAPFFLPSPLNLCLSILPSFWMGKAVLEESAAQLLPCFPTAAGWIVMLIRRARCKG